MIHMRALVFTLACALFVISGIALVLFNEEWHTIVGKAIPLPPVQGQGASAGTVYVYGQRLVASKHGIALTYHYQDVIGSHRMTTNSWGQLRSSAVEYPYGKTVTETGFSYATQKYIFTGKERDDSLYYFGARYYDPRTGRFVGVDPDRSTFAMYDYVNDNPLRYVDPTGKGVHELNEFLQGMDAGLRASIERFPSAMGEVVRNPKLLLGIPKNFYNGLRATFYPEYTFGWGTAAVGEEYAAGKAAFSVMATIAATGSLGSGGAFPSISTAPRLAMAVTAEGASAPVVAGSAALTVTGGSGLGGLMLMREAGDTRSGESTKRSGSVSGGEEQGKWVDLFRVTRPPRYDPDFYGPWATSKDEVIGMVNEGTVRGKFAYRYRVRPEVFDRDFVPSGNGYIPKALAEERIRRVGPVDRLFD